MHRARRIGVLVVCLAAAGLVSWPARAQEPPSAKEISQAIDRGVEYLSKIQNKDGSWPFELKGATTLATYTLLECGVSPNDDRVQRGAAYTRDYILQTDRTYEIALAMLLFGKLGDEEDLPLIEALALRLLAGQNPDHGWNYVCPPLADKDQKRLQEHLAKIKAAGPRKLPEQAPANPKPRDPNLVHADIRQQAAVINQKPIQEKGWPDFSDNSNTQFAMLALWVARRHGLPVERALARVELRFRVTQDRKVGGWGYHGAADPANATGADYQPTAAMTCCGLIGLALGHGAANPKAPKIDLNKDPAVKAALYVVTANLGEPGQERAKLALASAGRTYYYLWTLERMAVIYGFTTIGGKDWYRWGAELLLANQQGDGSWQGDYAQAGIDTCFALLFLKKANVAVDLTAKVGDKVKDPGKVPAELLDLIGRDVKPGVEMPKKKQAPNNEPREEQPGPDDSPVRRLPDCPLAQPGASKCPADTHPVIVARPRDAWRPGHAGQSAATDLKYASSCKTQGAARMSSWRPPAFWRHADLGQSA
jgi:hypothetical protein